jgi:hypothetical protein
MDQVQDSPPVNNNPPTFQCSRTQDFQVPIPTLAKKTTRLKGQMKLIKFLFNCFVGSTDFWTNNQLGRKLEARVNQCTMKEDEWMISGQQFSVEFQID